MSASGGPYDPTPPPGAGWGAPPAPPQAPGGYPPPGAPGGYPPPGYPPGGAYQAPKTNAMAVVSLVVGLVSLAICQPLGLAALIMGSVAKGQIRDSRGAQSGNGMALAGQILGGVALAFVVVAVFVIVVLIAMGNHVKNVFCNISTGLDTP